MDFLVAVKKSLVEIFTSQSIGAGFFVSVEGLILTNKHVIGLADSFTVRTHDEGLYTAEFVAASSDFDLALITSDCRAEHLLTANPNVPVSEGQSVYALGHPHGLRFSVSRGVVSSADREIDNAHYVQTDVAINPGNSGGPLIDESGRLVGVNTIKWRDSEGLGFALSVRHVEEFLRENGVL